MIIQIRWGISNLTIIINILRIVIFLIIIMQQRQTQKDLRACEINQYILLLTDFFLNAEIS